MSPEGTSVAHLPALLAGDELGWRLASLVDGEGHFAITVTGRDLTRFRCLFVLGLRADDRPFLELMQRSTGLGILCEVHRSPLSLLARPGSKPMVHWQINRRLDVVEFAHLLERYPLLSKKARDFSIWREAVDAWVSKDWQRCARLREALKATRRYHAPPVVYVPEDPQLQLIAAGEACDD